MELLTGKAYNDFENWFDKYAQKHHGLKGWLDIDLYLDEVTLPDELMCSLIIEWLDSVGYHVMVEPHIGGGADVYYAKVIYRMENFIDTWCNIENKEYQPSVFYFENRHEATIQAIKEANRIYNERIQS